MSISACNTEIQANALGFAVDVKLRQALHQVHADLTQGSLLRSRWRPRELRFELMEASC